ncbi:GTPase [Rossellomorea aquimaris]|uniref:GTPase n=1 Tax=Rossellomorea aquimaris TaxID=189382 RepID=UPI0015EFECA7|nr:GTPase [Rossellomorea aquimaris]
MDDFTDSLAEKKKHLDAFTLSLFGRTKAGKSTIREALTNGNGNTIGKGAQRTTRDILEYNWNGLRLLDVPGFEAFKGDEDADKAHDIIDQSDMIMFLTSDDSVQPGEFDEMSRLQELNKHFFVVMNVKYNLLNPQTEQPDQKEIRRFLKRPEKVFEFDRLSEHRKHIRSYVKKHLNIDHVEVIWIHAQSAFLSTLEELQEISEDLWDKSRLDTVYSKIAKEVNRSGKHRRVLTFYDSTVHFIDTIEKMLWEEQRLIRSQALFMVKKRAELKRFFDSFIPDGNERIEQNAAKLYSPIKQWVPYFVEEYIGKKDIHSVLQSNLKEKAKHIEKMMNNHMKELINELQSFLTEFTRQYQYDINSITLDSKNMSDFKKGQIGRVLKWGGVTLSGFSAGAFIAATAGWGAANVWNPVGWIALGASTVVGLISWFVSDYESKKWKKAKKDAKKDLLEHIEELERKTKGSYKAWFYENITKKGRREMLDKVEVYIDSLFFVADQLREKANTINELKEKINKQLFAHLLKLEGVNCEAYQLIRVAREQGVATKILVPSEWYLDGKTNIGLDNICGEHVMLVSETSDLRTQLANALYPATIEPDQVKIIRDGDRVTAKVNVPNSLKGLVIGKKGVNIRLAGQLCQVKIELNKG